MKNKYDKVASKNTFPFRLGCTSYVYPADILPNVRKMAPIVDDIELVLFESEPASNLPGRKVISALAELAGQYGLTYTIHFPIDQKAASPRRDERVRFQEQALKIMDLTHALAPFAYILHLEGIREGAGQEYRKAWKAGAMETCEEIARFLGPDRSLVAVENLGYPIEWHGDIVRQYGFSFCLDLGHLWLYRQDWETVLDSYLKDTRVIHLHGVSRGGDHLSLEQNSQDILTRLVREYLPLFSNVVTLEVFSEEATFGSIERLEQLWAKSY
jgi:sugar phosphate isomerase/epimerase